MEPPDTSDLYRPDDAPTDAEILAAIEYDPANAADAAEAEAATKAARWKPTSTRSANWAMERRNEKLAKIADREAEAAEMLAVLDEERAKVERWLTDSTARLRSGARHMEVLLTEWALEQRERTGDATIVLPAGKLRTTASAAAVTKVDGKAANEAAVEWARQHGLEVNQKVTETVDLAVIRQKVRIVDRVVFVWNPDKGDIGAAEAWEQRVGLGIEWNPYPQPPEHPWEPDGEWRVHDPKSGEVISPDHVEVRVGYFAVDADSGMLLDFLAVRPDSINVKVEPA